MMNQGLLILAAATLGLIVNTLAILAVAWRGGRVIGMMTSTLDQLSVEVRTLRETRNEHDRIIARTVVQLDDLERRVSRLEGS